MLIVEKFRVELLCPLRVVGVQLDVHERTDLVCFAPLNDLFYPDRDHDDAAQKASLSM